MHGLDSTARRGHLPAGLKLALALGFLIAVALMPRRLDLVYALPAAALAMLWLATRMPLRFIWRRLLVVEPVILGMTVLVLLRPQSAPVFLAVILKSNLCLFAMLLLGWTTPFPEILHALRHARVPGAMLTTLALMVRYLPVLAEESQRMQRARASRTFSPRRRVAWGSLATIIGQLFIRSADRAERIYLAMCARGWK